MILVVCPNLGIDVTLELDELRVGAVNRARNVRRHAGGKGVNLSRAVRSLGERPLLLGFAGGDELPRRLEDEDFEAALVPISSPSRTCTIVVSPDGAATVINEPGPEITDASPLLERFESILPAADAVALMGSLPPGLPPATYHEMVSLTRRHGTYCLVDTSGVALREALSARPSLVTPNRFEAEALLGIELESESQCHSAASELRTLGADIAVITRGKDGAVIAAAEAPRARCTTTLPVDVRYGNPTGAGDAFAAGLLAGQLRGFPLSEQVRLGVATANASLSFGYGRLRAKDVRIEAVRFERRKREP